MLEKDGNVLYVADRSRYNSVIDALLDEFRGDVEHQMEMGMSKIASEMGFLRVSVVRSLCSR